MVYILYFLLVMLPFDYGGPKFEVSIVTFSVYTFFINVCFFYAVLKSLWSKGYFFISPILFMFLVCMFYLLKLLFIDNFIQSGRLAFTGLYIPFISLVVVFIILDTPAKLMKGFCCFVSGISFYALYAIVETVFSFKRFEGIGVPAISSASYFIVGILCSSSSFRRRIVKATGVVLNILGLLATMSRVYMLTILFTKYLRRLAMRGKLTAAYTIFMISSLALTFILVYSHSIYSYKMSYEDIGKISKGVDRVGDFNYFMVSLAGRAYAYKSGLENFYDNPITGIGLQFGKYNITQHNLHIQFLESGGIVGYILYFMSLFLFFKVMDRNPVTRIESYVSIVVFLIVINSLTNGIMHGTMPVIMMIMMGFGLNLKRLKVGHNEV